MTRISLSLARKLKDAGLEWQPALHDEFAIPDRGMEDRTFVISDLLSTIQSIQGTPVVSFHGSLEWALDTLVTSEVVWMLSESQLRELVVGHLEEYTREHPPRNEPDVLLALRKAAESYVCEIYQEGEKRLFEGETASEAYGKALLQLIAIP